VPSEQPRLGCGNKIQKNGMDMKSTIGDHKDVSRGKEMYIMQNPPSQRKRRVNPSTFRCPPTSYTPQQLRTRLHSTLASLCSFTTEGVPYPDIKQAPLKEDRMQDMNSSESQGSAQPLEHEAVGDILIVERMDTPTGRISYSEPSELFSWNDYPPFHNLV
jgi:hypothetical protein